MVILLLGWLLIADINALTACDCQNEWKFEGTQYNGCDARKPKDKKSWCYVDGDQSSCPESKVSTVRQGAYWRYCSGGGDQGDTTAVHVVVTSNSDSDSMEDFKNQLNKMGRGHPHSMDGDDSMDSMDKMSLSKYSEGPGGPGVDSTHPLERTMSEGARLRNLWRELGHIEDAIHTANQHLKARLIRIFKIIRAKMVKFENEQNPDKKRSEGAKLRAAWAELGHIEKEIHITNQDMKRHLNNVINKMKEKMEVFDREAKHISGYAAAPTPHIGGPSAREKEKQQQHGSTSLLSSHTASMHESKSLDLSHSEKSHSSHSSSTIVMKKCVATGGKPGWSCNGLCLYPPEGGKGSCCRQIEALSVVRDNKKCVCPDGVESMEETQTGYAPFGRFLAEEDAIGAADPEMAPLKRTMSEGAKLRALWAELGHIEDEIHEANQVLKARLIKTFKVIRAHMVKFEQQKDVDKRRSEGSRLRAAWAQLGEIEKEIHITNIMMKRRLKKVIAKLSAKMKVFDSEASGLRGVESEVGELYF